MIRQAQPAPPLPCFGLEYAANDPRCQACPHATGCQKVLGPLLNKIPVSKVVYNLLPPAFQSLPTEMPDRSMVSLNGFFQEAHQVVYKRPSTRHLRPSNRHILTDAKKLGTTPFMFMVALLWSYQQTNPDATFSPLSFDRSDTSSRVASVKEVCLRKFASYDLRTMDGVLNEDMFKGSLRQTLLADEVMAGKFIVSRKIIAGGPSPPPLFRALELKLGLDWLAIEPSYRTFIAAEPSNDEAVREHRQRVLLRHGALKRTKALAVSVFQARELMAPEAVSRVLKEWNLEPCHLLTTDLPVTDMIQHWTHIGLCLQHRECLRALNGQPNIYGITLHL